MENTDKIYIIWEVTGLDVMSTGGSQYNRLSTVESLYEAWKIIKDDIKLRKKFNSLYFRTRVVDNTTLIDYGSHNHFYKIEECEHIEWSK